QGGERFEIVQCSRGVDCRERKHRRIGQATHGAHTGTPCTRVDLALGRALDGMALRQSSEEVQNPPILGIWTKTVNSVMPRLTRRPRRARPRGGVKERRSARPRCPRPTPLELASSSAPAPPPAPAPARAPPGAAGPSPPPATPGPPRRSPEGRPPPRRRLPPAPAPPRPATPRPLAPAAPPAPGRPGSGTT